MRSAPPRRPPPGRLTRPFLLALLLAAGLGGCDKCGNRVNINAPSLQHACGDNAQPSR